MSAVAAAYDSRRHFIEDVRPYLLCCAGGADNCHNHYKRRSSSEAEGYLPKRAGKGSLNLIVIISKVQASSMD